MTSARVFPCPTKESWGSSWPGNNLTLHQDIKHQASIKGREAQGRDVVGRAMKMRHDAALPWARGAHWLVRTTPPKILSSLHSVFFEAIISRSQADCDMYKRSDAAFQGFR
jgi:hypothetical protein